MDSKNEADLIDFGPAPMLEQNSIVKFRGKDLKLTIYNVTNIDLMIMIMMIDLHGRKMIEKLSDYNFAISDDIMSQIEKIFEEEENDTKH